MSRLFSKLTNLSQQKSSLISQPEIPVIPVAPITPIAPVAQEIEKRHFPAFLVLGIVLALGIMYLFGTLSASIGAIKNSIFVSMDANIQQQQGQIVALKNKLAVMQSSLSDRNNDLRTQLADIDKNMENKMDGLNNSINAKLDQSSIDTNRMEATLQANIDALKTKITKLQTSMQTAAATDTGSQNTAVSPTVTANTN